MPLTQADLIFSPASTTFSQTVSSLKRCDRPSLSSHLTSIIYDADFVCKVADAFKLPLIANERCGSWYVPTERKAGSVYFKSTDGHFGRWSFNLRRLNLAMLEVTDVANGYDFFFPVFLLSI